MKRKISFFLYLSVTTISLHAQSVSYTNFMTLRPGEKVIPLYSCMWLNANNHFYQLVIQSGGKYSLINNGVRKDNISQDDLRKYFASSTDCNDKDPHKPRVSTRYTGSKLVKYNSKGKPVITTDKKNYGPYEQIFHISEEGQKFVAVAGVVENGREEIFYVDSEGRKLKLAGKPLEIIVNNDLTKVAIVLPPAGSLPVDVLNKLPHEKKVEYLDKLSKQEQVIWFNNDSTGSLTRKYIRLQYDITGRRFVVVYGGYAIIDGKRVDVNMPAAGTRFFAGDNIENWAAYSSGYLNFSDKTSIKDAINPFMTTEGGKVYINWFRIESGPGGDVIKRGKKEL